MSQNEANIKSYRFVFQLVLIPTLLSIIFLNSIFTWVGVYEVFIYAYLCDAELKKTYYTEKQKITTGKDDRWGKWMGD